MRSRPASRVQAAWRGLLLAVLLLSLTASAQVVCAVCGKAVRGQYLQASGQSFCSQECYRKTLPVCAICRTVITGGHLIHEGRHYCSQACFQRILPTCAICRQPLQQSFTINGRTYCKAHADGPRCDACGLPVGQASPLADGRSVCAECRPGLVFEPGPAATLYTRAATLLAVAISQPLPVAPTLVLVGRDQLPTHSGVDAAISIRELGRYVRETETTTSRNVFGMVLKEDTRVTRRILLLYGLTPDRFLSTAVHELTHNLIAERYPAFGDQAPAWAVEGLCQYTSVLVCRRLGHSERVAEIESAEDPVYGDGYRWFVQRFGGENWNSIARWLDGPSFAALPRRAPASRAP